ncbi:MAG: hypothetical protein H6983_16945 [Ectothiorhodospiraceae bacterium]|nr:hypothetical protein [Ectothiorhodospiraceae bacterium]
MSPARKPRVTCVGVIFHDEVFHVDALPRADGKYPAREAYDCGGGMSATAAVAAARLGADAAFVGRVGDDARGAALRRGLEACGVDAGGLRSIPGATTAHSAVIVDRGGDRIIVSFQGSGLDPDAGWLPRADIARADAVVVDVRWQAGALAALEVAREAGHIGLLDADVAHGAEVSELLAAASHIAFSAPALRTLTGEGRLDRALRRVEAPAARLVAVTDGARGVWWREGSRVHRVPAPAVEARSTLGAGDVFHGALGVALAEGASARDAVDFAAVAAALKCTHDAGWEAMPTREEVARVQRVSAG